MSPTASVIITNRDYGRFLAEAIDSALAQPDVEVVVVDDGSVDDSPSVIETYGDRIEVVRLDGRGQGAAMNAGFAASTGDPVLFLDADDRLAPGILPAVVGAMAGPTARVHYPLRRIDACGRPTGGSVPPDGVRLPSGDLRAEVIAHPHDLAWQPTSANAYRRAVLEAVLPMPTEPYRTCADHYLNGLSALHGPVALLDRPGGDYRVHGDNADARAGFDLERIRGIVERAAVTGAHIAAEARRLGLAGEDRGSISQAANRLVSLRLGPERHPVAGDRRGRAWRDGLRACRHRSDLPAGRRAGAAALLCLLAVGPRRALAPLATRYVTGTTDVPGGAGAMTATPERRAAPEVRP